MITRILTAAALCLTALMTPAASQADEVTAVRAGSFNLRNAALPLSSGIAPWAQRRGVAIRQILSRDLDILGIQETSFGPQAGVKYASGASTQYLDLLRGLNAAGASYRLTSKAAYNCETARTPYRCVSRDRGAAGGDRIIFNAETLEMLSRGSMRYQAQSGSTRYLVWAAMRVRSTGHEFLFTTTHLSSSATARLAQWQEMIPAVDALKGSRPVIATGDFNVRKNHEIAEWALSAMKDAGYGDVLNQEYQMNPVARPRALETVNGWLGSFNGGRRNLAEYGYATKRHLTGNIIDYVFADNAMTVRRWEVVVDHDPRTLQTTGTLPSDHNLVVATLELP